MALTGRHALQQSSASQLVLETKVRRQYSSHPYTYLQTDIVEVADAEECRTRQT